MKKTKVKMIVDIAMSIVLFILMTYQFTEQRNHEISGAAMMILFLLHQALNHKWYSALGKGKYQLHRWIQVIVDGGLFIAMILLMLSGIGMSRYVFRFLNFEMSTMLARNLHMVCSYLCFLLIGIHIGLHFGMIRGKMIKMLHRKESSKIGTWSSRISVVMISIYGVYALIKRNFISYITLKMHFVFYDFEEPVVLYELDLLAIMILMICIGYYIQKLAILAKRKKRSN